MSGGRQMNRYDDGYRNNYDRYDDRRRPLNNHSTNVDYRRDYYEQDGFYPPPPMHDDMMNQNYRRNNGGKKDNKTMKKYIFSLFTKCNELYVE